MSSGPSPAAPQVQMDLRRWARLTQRLAVGTLIAALVLIVFGAYKLNSIVTEKQREISELNKQIEQRKTTLKQLDEDYQKLREIANAPIKQSAVFDQLRPIAKALPADKGSDGTQHYNFFIRLEAPESVLEQIARVTYHLDHPSFKNKAPVSTNSRDGFEITYYGWGALRLVPIDVELKNGKTHTYYFDMMKALGW